jgi:4-hydroxybenzoate polyprenyltransferase
VMRSRRPSEAAEQGSRASGPGSLQQERPGPASLPLSKTAEAGLNDTSVQALWRRKVGRILKPMRLGEQPTSLVCFLYGALEAPELLNSLNREYTLIGFGLIMSSIAAFILNEYADRDTDFWHEDRNPADLSRDSATILVSIFATAGISLGLLGGSYFCVPGSFVCGILYSLPCTRLKGKAGWDFVSLALAFIIFPYLTSFEIRLRTDPGSASAPSMLNLFFLIFFLGACNVIAMARDIDADRDAGLKNTSVRLGRRKFLLLGLLMISAAQVTGLMVSYQHHGLWYSAMLIFCPPVAATLGYGLGSRHGSRRNRKRLAAASQKGVLIGNMLTLYLLAVGLWLWFS